jgi:hypothetical protein
MDDETMTMMADAIDELINNTPEKILVAQVVVDGAIYAGALRRTAFPGIYEVLAPMSQQGSKVPTMVRILVRESAITAIMVAAEESPIARPSNGGLVIPGKRG